MYDFCSRLIRHFSLHDQKKKKYSNLTFLHIWIKIGYYMRKNICTCLCAWSISACPNCSIIRLQTVDYNH